MQKHLCKDTEIIYQNNDYTLKASPFAIVGSLLSFSGLCYRNSSGLPISNQVNYQTSKIILYAHC